MPTDLRAAAKRWQDKTDTYAGVWLADAMAAEFDDTPLDYSEVADVLAPLLSFVRLDDHCWWQQELGVTVQRIALEWAVIAPHVRVEQIRTVGALRSALRLAGVEPKGQQHG